MLLTFIRQANRQLKKVCPLKRQSNYSMIWKISLKNSILSFEIHSQKQFKRWGVYLIKRRARHHKCHICERNEAGEGFITIDVWISSTILLVGEYGW